jgi:hypothetical protein
MWEPRRLTTLWASTACYRDRVLVHTLISHFCWIDFNNLNEVSQVGCSFRVLLFKCCSYLSFLLCVLFVQPIQAYPAFFLLTSSPHWFALFTFHSNLVSQSPSFKPSSSKMNAFSLTCMSPPSSIPPLPLFLLYSGDSRKRFFSNPFSFIRPIWTYHLSVLHWVSHRWRSNINFFSLIFYSSLYFPCHLKTP